MVPAGRNTETIGVSSLAVIQKAIEFVVIIRMCPWSVIVICFPGVQQIARPDFLRYAENGPPIAVHATLDLEEVPGQRLEKRQLGISSRAIVPDIGIIRTFLIIYPLHKFWNDGVHVRVPLAMS